MVTRCKAGEPGCADMVPSGRFSLRSATRVAPTRGRGVRAPLRVAAKQRPCVSACALPVRPWADAHVAEGDRTVVPLEQQRSDGDFLVVPGVAGRSLDLCVLVDQGAVEAYLDEAGVGDLLAVGIETRGLEDHVQGLPFPR